MKELTTFSNRAVVVRYVCFQAVSVYFYVLVSCSGIVSYLSVYKIPPLQQALVLGRMCTEHV